MSSRPEAERALIRAGGSSSDDETERFYALRVSDYARVLTLLFIALYVVGVVFVLVLVPESFIEVHLHPAKLAHLAFVVIGLAIWQGARRPRAPSWLVTAGDVLLPIGVSLGVFLVAALAPPWQGLYFVPLLIGVLLLVMRAALVPSPPRRTALVGAVTAVPIALAARALATTEPLAEPLTPTFVVLAAAAWGVAITIATVMVSRMIYGLRDEIRHVRRLGQYVLGDLIGEGGMGSVYRAEHAMLRRPTAVKMLSPERAGLESIARFEREVQLTARLTHPNTVAIYDYGRTRDGTFYYAMEYLDGLSLEELVARFGPQPPGRVIHILAQAASALAEAHALGLIHRDIKPANMLFCERGGVPDVVKLVDFGLVKNLEPEGGPSLTHTNALTGTPLYLAPEAITDPANVDPRLDIYGLGCVAYFLLTGRPPFEGKSVLEICGHHLHTEPRPPSDFSKQPIPPELEALVLACLAKQRDGRPSSAEELRDALVRSAIGSPWPADEAKRFWRELGKSADSRAVRIRTDDRPSA